MLDPVVKRYCPDSPWTNARVDELKDSADAGLSASQIANKLDCNVTRCAVIGKLRRLGVKLARKHKPPSIPRTPRVRIRKPQTAPERSPHWWKSPSLVPRYGHPEPKPAPLPEIPEVVLEPRNIALVDLEAHHCRYPVETEPFLFCGHQRDGDEPYCAAHCRLCFQMPRR
jgi:hypothetical protein